jgi:polysaccharide export outer membrane protein
MKKNLIGNLIGLLIACGLANAQAPAVQTPPAAPATPELNGQIDQLRPNYVLRAGDQILIRAFEMEEIGDRPYRIDGDGFISLPVLGKLQAGGLSVEKLEATLVDLLRKYVKLPQVTITVVQFSSEPVFFVGAFKVPGIYPLAGRRTLVEMISSVGGLQPTASRRIKITRRKEYGLIPLSSAVTTSDGNASSLEVNMASLHENVNPAEDIILKPFDVISVERAEMVYVTGEVGHVGAFELQERESMSVIQVLTLAGGITAAGNPKTALILRPITNTSRRAEISLNLERILKGQDNDKPLLPNDVLYIPKNHKISGRTILIALPVVTSVASIALLLTR